MSETIPDGHLTPEELEYQQAVLAQVRATQVLADFWRAHLARRYQLGPLDQVLEDGTVRRG